MSSAQPVGLGTELRRDPFAESELPPQALAVFAECHQAQTDRVQWRGWGTGRHIVLPSGVTFFPLPVQTSPVGIIAAVTLLCLGIVAIGMGVAAPFVEGPQALAHGVVVGLFGAAMLVAAVLLIRILSKRKKERLAQVQPFGLYLLPTALVLRLPPTPAAPHVGSWCELYPRALITIDKWQGFGGAGTGSQASGSISAYVRLRWTNPDGSTGERILDWPLGHSQGEMLTELQSWKW